MHHDIDEQDCCRNGESFLQQSPLCVYRASARINVHIMWVIWVLLAPTCAVLQSITGASVRAVNPDISQRWLVLARRGSCGVTERGRKGLCTYGDQGAFNGLALDGLLQGTRTNWSAAATACLEQCASCERCRFVTLNIGPFFDCSWFSSCKLSDLAQGQGHISGKAPKS